MRSLEIDESAAEAWLRGVLGAGLTMASLLLERLSLGKYSALLCVGDGFASDGLDLRFGGTGGATPWQDLAQDIVDKWPEGRVLVEVPLARPTDVGLKTMTVDVEFCDEEVYAATSTQAGGAQVEHALRSADPSVPYVALVACESSGLDRGCPTDRLRTGELTPMRVIVGAFDGEGFLVADMT